MAFIATVPQGTIQVSVILNGFVLRCVSWVVFSWLFVLSWQGDPAFSL